MRNQLFRAGAQSSKIAPKGTLSPITRPAINRKPVHPNEVDEYSSRLAKWKKERSNLQEIDQSKDLGKGWKLLKKNRIHTSSQKKVNEAIKRLQWPWYIVHPNSGKKILWDVILGMTILFVVISIPVRLCFELQQTNDWLIVDFVGDGLFLLDTIFFRSRR